MQTLKPSNQLLPYISKALRLSPIQEVTFGLALLHSSNSDTVLFATHFLKQKLPDLIRTYINSGKLLDMLISSYYICRYKQTVCLHKYYSTFVIQPFIEFKISFIQRLFTFQWLKIPMWETRPMPFMILIVTNLGNTYFFENCSHC